MIGHRFQRKRSGGGATKAFRKDGAAANVGPLVEHYFQCHDNVYFKILFYNLIFPNRSAFGWNSQAEQFNSRRTKRGPKPKVEPKKINVQNLEVAPAAESNQKVRGRPAKAKPSNDFM